MAMKARLLLSMLLALSPSLGLAQDQLTITNNNSSLKVTRDPATFVGFGPSDPLRLPRTMEWTVDGRTILVYPSAPWDFIDVEHFHTDAHVGVQQLHAQGPMLGFATSAVEGSVTGGAIYTVAGSAIGTGRSRIVEKVDIHNKSASGLPVSLAGMGFNPPSAS